MNQKQDKDLDPAEKGTLDPREKDSGMVDPTLPSEKTASAASKDKVVSPKGQSNPDGDIFENKSVVSVSVEEDVEKSVNVDTAIENNAITEDILTEDRSENIEPSGPESGSAKTSVMGPDGPNDSTESLLTNRDNEDSNGVENYDSVNDKNSIKEEDLANRDIGIDENNEFDSGNTEPSTTNPDEQAESIEDLTNSLDDDKDENDEIENTAAGLKSNESSPSEEEDLTAESSESKDNRLDDTRKDESTDGDPEEPTESIEGQTGEHDVGGSEPVKGQSTNDDLITEVVNRCLSADANATEKEIEEFNSAIIEAQAWNDCQRVLRSSIYTLQKFFSAVLDKFEKVNDTLPQNIREELASRKEGILLCGRMLDRAQKRICVDKSEDEEDEVATLDELNVEALKSVAHNSPPDKIEEVIYKFLKSRRIDNNRQILDARNQTRAAEKSFLSSVERLMLPIIDGLDEGKKIGVAAIEKTKDQNPEEEDNLESWFGVYDQLIGKLESEFELLGLQPQIASPGEMVDYELYDPIDVEEDPRFEDEQVKEMVRRGYVLVDSPGGGNRVVRPGQVVVVKNPPKE